MEDKRFHPYPIYAGLIISDKEDPDVYSMRLYFQNRKRNRERLLAKFIKFRQHKHENQQVTSDSCGQPPASGVA